MKSLFQSVTLIGVFVSLVSKALGIQIHSGEVSSVLDNLQILWPVLIGILADLGSFWTRFKTTKFDAPLWKTKTFWLQVLSGSMTLGAAFGFNLEFLQDIFDQGLSAWPAVTALIGTLTAIFGRAIAKQKLALPGAK
jgi:hypothetical protein